MRILYLHQYFSKPSQGGALRSYFLARALVAAGHQVDLITAHSEPGYRQETVEGINVHYLPVPYDNGLEFKARLQAFLKYAWHSTRLALRLGKFDLCYATSTPLTVGLTALAMKKIRRLPFYFEVRDLWPSAPVELGIIRNKKLIRLLQALEKRIYRAAEKVIALSPGILQGIKPYKPSWALHLLPNMADVEFFTPGGPERTKPTDPFYICYFGALGRANRVEFLLAAARACREQNLPQVRFLLAGKGAEEENLKQMTRDWDLTNVSWLGYLNREKIKHLLAGSHATYTSFDTFPILETNSPNKFFDSLAAGKLTIVNTSGWLCHLVEQNKCGFYANPENPAEFVRKLQPFLEDPELLSQTQAHARQLAEDQFSRETITRQFLALFRQ